MLRTLVQDMRGLLAEGKTPQEMDIEELKTAISARMRHWNEAKRAEWTAWVQELMQRTGTTWLEAQRLSTKKLHYTPTFPTDTGDSALDKVLLNLLTQAKVSEEEDGSISYFFKGELSEGQLRRVRDSKVVTRRDADPETLYDWQSPDRRLSFSLGVTAQGRVRLSALDYRFRRV